MAKYWSLVLFLLCFNCMRAADYPVTYAGIENGLSNNAVTCIFKDHKGFMWFGTYDGLNRYDGYEFKIFRNRFQDSSSLISNWVYSIAEDFDHRLWVGCRVGICTFNPLSEKFSRVYYTDYFDKSKKQLLSDVLVNASDKSGNIFICTRGLGLLVYQKGNRFPRQIPLDAGGKQLTNYDVLAIAGISDASAWLFVNNIGLCLYDRLADKIRIVNTSITFANCLEQRGKQLWIGTNNGLFRYNITTNQYDETITELRGGLSFDRVNKLLFTRNGELWIATNGNGISILNPATKAMRYLLPGNEPYSLTSGSVDALYEDADLRKWIGTLRGGINILDQGKSRFNTIRHDPANPNSLINNFALSFAETDDKDLWIGTDGGGLSRWNRVTNQFTNYKHNPADPGSLSNNFVSSIQQDITGDIWIATYGGGINKYNRHTRTFLHYSCVNPATGLEDRNVWKIFLDKKNNLWVSTYSNGGLYRFNRQAGKFELFNKDLKDLICMTGDSEGNLLMGNKDELIEWNDNTKKIHHYRIGRPVRSLLEDRFGNFWVGTEEGGLLLFDRKNQKIIERYTTSNGLCNNAVLNILEDGTGHIWASTFNGISRVNVRSKKIKNYFSNDGLQSNQFNFNAALRLHSGELVFGGIKGFNIFQPDSIAASSDMPTLLLTDIIINNSTREDARKFFTKASSDRVEAITVPYDKSMFTFNFTALEYSSPNKIIYSWKMEHWDRDWNYTTSSRTATYTHLEEGKYIFRVRSTNAEGDWNTQEIALVVTVLPPWYRSWWAYLIYSCIFGGLVVAYLMYQTHQTRLKYEIELANLNTEKEKAIAEKEREMHEKRLSFFTNVSHEFRGPLTLIINPLKEALENKTLSDQPENRGLHIIYRNARRLRSLVDQLLLFRKADSGVDRLHIANLNLFSLCNEVYLCFVQQAKSKNIHYEFEADNQQMEIYADREKLEIVLFNLISNALKYTPDKGSVLIKLSETQQHAVIRVSDTGIGIPETEKENIFTKYYQATNLNSVSKTGFGIGLFLVKHFTEAHKGSIDVDTAKGEGTLFTLTLHKGMAHFEGLDIMEDIPHQHDLLHELSSGQTEQDGTGLSKKASETLPIIVTGKSSILIIDDDPEIRRYVVQIFKTGYQLYEAENGQEGIAAAQKYLPDIIICDIKMQGISGIELCKMIKEDPALNHIPVILLTGSSSSETKLMGIEGGADDYITKPFEKEILVARVTNLIRARNNLQKYFFNEITLNKGGHAKISAEYKEFLERCIAVVEAHLEDDSFTVKDLLTEMGMSHSALFRKVKSISGQSINVFIRFLRLRKAAELFINTDHNVNETAFQVGIRDVKYFREQFSKVFGMNPSDYIKRYRRPFGGQFSVNKDSFTGQDPTS